MLGVKVVNFVKMTVYNEHVIKLMSHSTTINMYVYVLYQELMSAAKCSYAPGYAHLDTLHVRLTTYIFA